MPSSTPVRARHEARRVLAAGDLFSELSADERKSLVAPARVRTFSSGETIFLMGAEGESMMAVLSGRIRISVGSTQGRELVIADMEPGDFFGELALLDGKPRSADAKAVTACSVAVLERRDVMAFFDRHPRALASLVQVLCRRLRAADEQAAEIGLLDLPVRLARALLRLAGAATKGGAAPSLLQINKSQRELGNMVGATRESINKCLRTWQRSGIIKIENNVIAITNGGALQRFAEGG